MESRAKAFGHAVHPMLIPFPLGLLATAVVFDIVYLVSDRQGFAVAAAYMIAAGIVGGALAAPFGWIDWFKIPPDTRAKRVGLTHGLGNAVVLVLFAVSWLARLSAESWQPNPLALACSFVAVLLAVATAWMGGELVERLGVGVEAGADVNAPSSLSQRHMAA
jgi:uncharacterized membrane protein